MFVLMSNLFPAGGCLCVSLEVIDPGGRVVAWVNGGGKKVVVDSLLLTDCLVAICAQKLKFHVIFGLGYLAPSKIVGLVQW